MQEYEIKVKISDKEYKVVVEEKTKLGTIAADFQKYFSDDIILAIYNGKLRELNKSIDKEGVLSFVTTSSRDGKKTYRRSVTLLMQKAVEHIFGSDNCVRVIHSLGEGYYCELYAENGEKKQITDEILYNITDEMNYLVDENLPITKHSVKTDKAEDLFRLKGMNDKERLFHYRRSSRVNLYNLDGLDDYFYGFMAPSTGMLKYFKLEKYEEGFILLFPKSGSMEVEPFHTSKKLYDTLKESREWSKMLGIGNIGALNDAIASGEGQNVMLLQEAIMEKNIGKVAEMIAKDSNKKFVMIAGPSSSGKTSFANRLSIQLTAKGLKPHPLSLDDYYADREFCPRNPDGSFDYECLEALDVKKFNEDMVELLNGNEIMMPSFNFKTGKREYRGKKLRLGDDDILVIEGIHGLNDKLSHMLPGESKFKIYISALTQLNIDEHNPLPTTDGRLLRRIVRDARTRGTTAQETIAMWPSVRNGEEKYIFPFQDEADVMFNSALLYEISVLKVYAEPLLFQIPRESDEYLEAKRLLKFLDYFLPMPSEGISKNSLLREFVGGSCFNV
ncbi:MAG: nucleoside kinase [Agathobacter sp.]|nr:nucleoside kinase [Agathobacter sp.]